MSAAFRIAAFALLLAAAFAVSALGGRALDVAPRTLDGAEEAGHADEDEAMEPVRATPPGLSLSEGGLVLAPERTTVPRGRAVDFRFRIVDRRGRPVRDFALLHERPMHLVVARRDLTGFQHVHPTQLPDGTWTTPLRLAEAGSYRAFADFESGGARLVLGVDLTVPGTASPQPLPTPEQAVRTGPYRVELAGARDVSAGETATLRFRVGRDGQPVLPEPYLGARGHLVILREGDLAYVHAHPEEGATARAGTVYETELPSAGRYRLFLQFRRDGSVHTARFTVEARP